MDALLILCGSAIESRMRWDFSAWGKVRFANETPGIKSQLIQSSEGAPLTVNQADHGFHPCHYPYLDAI